MIDSHKLHLHILLT